MTGLQAGRLQPSLRSVERTCPEWERPHRAKALGYRLLTKFASHSIPPRCRMSRHKVRRFSSFTLPTVGQQWDRQQTLCGHRSALRGRYRSTVLPFGLALRRARRMPARCVGLAAFTHATKCSTEVRYTPERNHSVHFRLARDRNRYAPPSRFGQSSPSAKILVI